MDTVSFLAAVKTCFFNIPNAEGIHLDLSLAISEKSDGLMLQTMVTLPGYQFGVCFATCLNALFRLVRTISCEHSRNIFLKESYARSALKL